MKNSYYLPLTQDRDENWEVVGCWEADFRDACEAIESNRRAKVDKSEQTVDKGLKH